MLSKDRMELFNAMQFDVFLLYLRVIDKKKTPNWGRAGLICFLHQVSMRMSSHALSGMGQRTAGNSQLRARQLKEAGGLVGRAADGTYIGRDRASSRADNHCKEFWPPPR